MADHSVYMFRLFFRPPVWYKSSLPNRKFAFRSPCLGSGGWSVAILQVRARETGRAFAGVRFLNWIIPTYTNNYMHKELVELLVFTCRRISLYHLTPSLTSGPVTRGERFCIAALPPPCAGDFFPLFILFQLKKCAQCIQVSYVIFSRWKKIWSLWERNDYDITNYSH